MSSPTPPRARAGEAALRALAAGAPGALFGAIDPNAGVTAVGMPPQLGLPDGRVIEEGTLIDRVVDADRAIVAKVWGQARSRGVGVAPVRLRTDPERPGPLYMFDLRASHGVMVVAYVEAGTAPDIAATDGAPQSRPRFGRAYKDASSVYQRVDPAVTEILGWEADELIGRRTLEFAHPDDIETAIASWLQMLDTPGPGPRIRLRHRHRDGSWVWLEVVNHNRLGTQDGDVVTEMVDISEEMAAHEALRARERLLAQLTDSVPVGLFHADCTGALLFTNKTLQAITGIEEAGTVAAQLAAVVDEDRPVLEAALARAGTGAEMDIELSIRPRAGGVRHCLVGIRPLVDDAGAITGITGCVEDVTTMIRSRRELEIRAASDPLTGALNRDAATVALQAVIDDHRPGAGTAAIFLDLDGFKRINDEMGHAAGDDFLVAVAGRIRRAIRAGDILGRFGGDEFIVGCGGVPGPDQALAMAQVLAGRVFPGLADGAGPAVLRASIGVAWTDAAGARADDLIRAADAAMYESKRAGRGEPAMARPLQGQLA